MVRAAALRALAMFPNSAEAREGLRQAQSDRDVTVRYAASQASFAPLHDAFGEQIQGVRMVYTAADVKSGGEKLGGALSDISLETFCRALARAEASGLVNIQTATAAGQIYFDAGLIINAAFEGKMDKDAFRLLAKRSDGFFFFKPGEQAQERRMLSPVDALFEESARDSGSPADLE